MAKRANFIDNSIIVFGLMFELEKKTELWISMLLINYRIAGQAILHGVFTAISILLLVVF